MNEQSILFEDNDLVVINKPPGIVVNRAQTVTGETIQDWMEQRYASIFEQLKIDDSELNRVFRERSGLAHRIDKDTSGVLVLAKNPMALEKLMEQFKERLVHKEYVAIVHGRFNILEDWISIPVARLPGNRKRFGVVSSGKETKTYYKVMESFESTKTLYTDGFSLVRFWPKTGRTHQIRVVCKHLHRPIVGDWLYVGRKRAKQDAKWVPRQCLHAASIEFTHPVTSEKIHIEAPLPDDMMAVLEQIKHEQF